MLAVLPGFHCHFNSRPHEEVDLPHRLHLRARIVFQLTTSRRGRPPDKRSGNQIHTFQLTTSRRGRRSMLAVLPGFHCHFNSRPHEEVDLPHRLHLRARIVFQLTTSRRGRPPDKRSGNQIHTFQLTTSRRGRREFGDI